MTQEIADSNINMLKGDATYLSVSHKKVLDNLPLGVIITTKENLHIEYLNGFFAAKSGYDTNETAKPSFTFRSLLEEKYQDVLTSQLNNTDDVVLYDIKTAAGLKKYHICITHIFDDQGIHAGYQFTLTPETSHQSLPFFSSETKDLFLKQFKSFGFGTFEWMTDSDNLIWSDSVYDIYEIDKDIPLTYSLIKTLHHPEDKQLAVDALSHSIKTGEPFEYEIRIVTQSKRIKYVLCMGKLITDSAGIKKITGSIREVTWQKESDFSLKKHLNELNRSNKELEEFAYITSHDLQEPLRKVSTFSERLSEKAADSLDEEGNFYLKRIMAAASNMRMLINNLLDFSRVTKGELSFTRTNIDFIIREVKNDLELKISESNAVINCSALPTIETDPFQIRQLFLNLLGNALKFKDASRSPVITITSAPLTYEQLMLHGLELDKTYHQIEVSDNGIGFEDEYVSRIFQIFQRLHGKAEYPGSGIGLAICKKIVDHHHGIIYASSVLGQGAIFTIILPEKQS